MPTRGRPEFAAKAIEMFLAQTYRRSELRVVDELQNPSLENFGSDRVERVFCEWLESRQPIGAKRNLAISSSLGDVIMHWDDDDIYDPRRIEDQIERLLKSDALVTGYNAMEFLCANGSRWYYEGVSDYAIGTSLCYRREFWRENPFPGLHVGEDNAFVDAARKSRRFVCVPANNMIVATIHENNTSPRTTMAPMWRRIAA